MNKTKKGNTRTTGKEQYYTIPSVAGFCVEKMRPFVKDDSVILEPCGGKGDFIKEIKKAGFKNKIVSCDIEPKAPKIVKSNFIESCDFIREAGFVTQQDYVTITNPPFGRANSLSVKFFNGAAIFSRMIGFIIPKAWKKWTIINRLDDNFHLVEEYEMPDVCFYSEEKGEYENKNLNTLFQIWERRDYKRKKIEVPDHKLIKRTDHNDADFVLVTFGWETGKVKREFEKKPNTCYNFFKIEDTSKDVVKALEEIDFSIFYNNVSYTQCLGLQEINWCLNEYYGLPNLTGVDSAYLPNKLLLKEENK